MLVIPAIDLKDGQCVRLKQGRMDDATSYGDDPVAMAARWVEAGARRLHLVDLNGAFEGKPVNGDAVTAIARAYPDLPIQIGGGIRSAETIEHYLKAGVSYVIIGTKAVKEPDFVTDMCRAFPGHIIVGLDAKEGFVATDGWAEVSTLKATDLAKRFADDGVSSIVYTDIARDGMMQGVNIEATAELAREGGLPVIASGGVTNLDDIQALCKVADSGILGAITGRAIYEGSLDLADAQRLSDQLTGGRK
ncbi:MULTISPECIES: 1-(5-phosphoribosyl)-5-[(5-phosphoribosylamino)methylideneamino]imidazole-4-carboxamide isomerase [Halomonadaceae]|jgi:phosphoribosylformimino-5-aminoimidazole carboxamide ribotide isomerase|uniref:1-(5-phosphoribosyl)-5-[(5- phosphoribosylamino)methylideneamino]imidazole-4- carboxamide isomerase n=1 Tax=Halomonadaceae TaxID=28256 RepID=UPI000A28AD5B|nr:MULTISPECIES: 1-(5-phosphoribosyl)-5-[(5-phosphoribosylamino)methylideneamino]imidazole-4-carboxamide isomerase [Halomonas]MCW4153693.1 1-(5-phosphoribosyl)-5-[(5-phosphoribosylamino)methylideneamino]imidazole-4-carboxamide isomerase [Halomonas sp. 18H]MDR5887510.1 1-(5-phosphoribosyl)-5-[(5-phosphoribosylamino)methylideneamino]imidazole-4-carboxamide isomerase [Halomonas janggokensis]QPL46595.1 1-(5-phosphoribosyl)-5-[(5-phosphoribosylamino)methylideneamino]imidazole-4-carboxamide isomerase 